MRLLVTMAVPDKNHQRWVKTETASEPVFTCARIEIIDWERKCSLNRIDYRPPPENLEEGLSVRFTGGCPWRGRWFQTTSTELVIFDMADWSVERVISHTSFNDLHGVAVIDNEIAVVNTGLEMVQFLDTDGQIVREMNVASKPTWERFDRSTDYRKVVSTKPHEVHVNHAFKLDGQWWATRCLMCDAINLNNPKDRIEIAVGHPHDGFKRGDFVYFTTTNGHIVVANATTRKVEEVINIEALDSTEGLKGWCRGLEIDGNYAYVGFTRLRATKWKKAFRVFKDIMHGSARDSHICKIDLKRKAIVDTLVYKDIGSAAIFSLANYDLLAQQVPDA